MISSKNKCDTLQKAEEDTEDGGTGSKRSLRTVLESSVEDGLLAPSDTFATGASPKFRRNKKQEQKHIETPFARFAMKL